MEGGLVGVHLVAGRVGVDEEVTGAGEGREGDLAPGEQVRLQAGGRTDARRERPPLGPGVPGQEDGIGQVLAVEPLFGQAQTGAVHGQDPVAGAFLDALDAEDRGSGLVEQGPSGFQEQQYAGVAEEPGQRMPVALGAGGQERGQGLGAGDGGVVGVEVAGVEGPSGVVVAAVLPLEEAPPALGVGVTDGQTAADADPARLQTPYPRREAQADQPGREVGPGLEGVAGEVEGEPLHAQGVPGPHAPVQCRGQFRLGEPEAAVGPVGRQAAQQDPGRTDPPGEPPADERDERVEFVQGVDGDQRSVPDGQVQQSRILRGPGDDEVLAPCAVPQGLAQLAHGGHVHAGPAGRGAFDEDGGLVGLLREVHEPLDPGRGQGLPHAPQVGVEGLGQQEVERAAEGVGEFGQQSARQYPLGGFVGQDRHGGQGGTGRGGTGGGGRGGTGPRGGAGPRGRTARRRRAVHAHSATSVPRPWARASWAKRCPRAMSVTTRPLL